MVNILFHFSPKATDVDWKRWGGQHLSIEGNIICHFMGNREKKWWYRRAFGYNPLNGNRICHIMMKRKKMMRLENLRRSFFFLLKGGDAMVINITCFKKKIFKIYFLQWLKKTRLESQQDIWSASSTLFIFYKNLVYKNIKPWNCWKIKNTVVILLVAISISFEDFRKTMTFL